MDQFRENVEEILSHFNISKHTIVSASESFKDPANDEKLEDFFHGFYSEWRKNGKSMGNNVALKILMPGLNKTLAELQSLFEEYDEQPGIPLSRD